MQCFSSMPRLYYVNQVATRFWLRRYCVNSVVTTSLWRPHGVLTPLRPRYVNFEHVQCSSTCSASMETTSRPYRFLLRSHGVVQVPPTSCRFFVDVVGTWPGVTGAYTASSPLVPYHAHNHVLHVFTTCSLRSYYVQPILTTRSPRDYHVGSAFSDLSW